MAQEEGERYGRAPLDCVQVMARLDRNEQMRLDITATRHYADGMVWRRTTSCVAPFDPLLAAMMEFMVNGSYWRQKMPAKPDQPEAMDGNRESDPLRSKNQGGSHHDEAVN